MKILAVSDIESKYLWDYFEPKKLEGVELILSCGALAAEYLSFLATFTHAPVLYVHGNHDAGYENQPPEGCICIEDEIFTYRGVRILGLGGSMRYKPGPHQFSQWDMNLRVLKLRYKLWRAGGFDILLTHSPAFRNARRYPPARRACPCAGLSAGPASCATASCLPRCLACSCGRHCPASTHPAPGR